MGKLMTKRDRGAVLFQTFFNKLREDFERIDNSHIRSLRVLGEMKRRLDTLEETVRLHGLVLFDQEPRIKLTCISCNHQFELSLPEATAQNFTSVCPKCHGWALPLQREREYSLKEIAQITGFAYGTVCQAVREMQLKPRGEHRLFGKSEKKKIEAVLSGKKPRKKLEGEKNGSDSQNQG